MNAAGDRTHSLTVEEGASGRLDRFVATALDLSRTRVQGLLAEGRITVDGRPAKKSDTASPGTRIEVVVPPSQAVEMQPEDIPIDIVYEDADVAVVDKPAGMVVHPAPGHRTGTLVNALLWRMPDIEGVGGRQRPGIVHRLDRDTSGLLVVAKSDRAHRGLSDALRRRRVKRLYLAVAWGHLAESPLTVDAPIGRDRKNRKKMAVVPEGRPALTRLRVRERWERADLLDVALKTGRTHQIRVHLAHIGHPVVGDSVYGEAWERGMGGPTRQWAVQLARMAARQFLHAAELGFDHPVSGERMRFASPLPPDLAAVAEWARSTTGSQNPA
jgi:23S rRNA pseudouridine1911/1915/1917 synthase